MGAFNRNYEQLCSLARERKLHVELDVGKLQKTGSGVEYRELASLSLVHQVKGRRDVVALEGIVHGDCENAARALLAQVAA